MSQPQPQLQPLPLYAWIAWQNDPHTDDRAGAIAADIQQFRHDEEVQAIGSSTDLELHWLLCE